MNYVGYSSYLRDLLNYDNNVCRCRDMSNDMILISVMRHFT